MTSEIDNFVERAAKHFGADMSHETVRLLRVILTDPATRSAVKRRIERHEADRRSRNRGPKRRSHLRDMEIYRRWQAYRASHGNKSVGVLAPKFLASLPRELQPATSARGRESGSAPAKILSTLLSRAKVGERQRPMLRKLVAVMTDCERLTARGTRDVSAARAAIRTFRRWEAKDFAEIERLIHEHGLLKHSATTALLGDAFGSFIRLPPEK